ncbi:MAG: hypothetical protein JWN34_5291 [Bryobacterales bacterium]|nr:hypothetical protein [Bryobacterales bacterium]
MLRHSKRPLDCSLSGPVAVTIDDCRSRRGSGLGTVSELFRLYESGFWPTFEWRVTRYLPPASPPRTARRSADDRSELASDCRGLVWALLRALRRGERSGCAPRVIEACRIAWFVRNSEPVFLR